MNETAFDFRASWFDFFAGEEIVQRVFQIGMAGVLLLGSVSESIIDGSAIKQFPGLWFDAESFRGSSCAHRTRDGLGMIQEHGKIDCKVPRLLTDGFRVIVSIGIDE